MQVVSLLRLFKNIPRVFLAVGIWLLFYAVIRFIDVYRGHGVGHFIEGPNNKLSTTLMSAAVLHLQIHMCTLIRLFC